MRSLRLTLPILTFLGLFVIVPQVPAQDTTIYIDLPDLIAYPGDSVIIPIQFSTFTDTVEAWAARFALNRPGLLFFSDTMPGGPPIRSAGTLTEGWDLTLGEVFVSTAIKLTAFSDISGDSLPPGIPPLTIGETLARMVGWVPCEPELITGNVVRVDPTALLEFSNEAGALILPVSGTGGTVTILLPAKGDFDHSGAINILDIVRLVNCAFKSDCPACMESEADINCDGNVNVLDVVLLINHAFKGGALPGC